MSNFFISQLSMNDDVTRRMTSVINRQRSYTSSSNNRATVAQNYSLFEMIIIASKDQKEMKVIGNYPERIENLEIEIEQMLPFIFPSKTCGISLAISHIIDAHIFNLNTGESNLYGIVAHLNGNDAPNFGFTQEIIYECQEVAVCFLTYVPQFNVMLKITELLLEYVNEERSDINGLIKPSEHVSDPIFGQLFIDFVDTFQKMSYPLYQRLLGDVFPNIGPFNYSLDKFIHPGMEILLTKLSVADIVELYSSVILEKQIVITGLSLYEVSNVVMSLIFLIDPFKITTNVFPILPDDETHIQIFDAPFPFIAGFVGMVSPNKLQEGTMIVNLDAKMIINHTNLLIPAASTFPRKIGLILNRSQCYVPTVGDRQAYKDFWARHSSLRTIPDFEKYYDLTFSFDNQTVDLIIKTFKSSMNFCMNDNLNICIIIDINSRNRVFMRDLFTSYYNPNNQNEFITAFMQTQLFDDYVNEYICNS